MRIDARLLPVALYCEFRRAAHGGDFPEREATDKLHIYNLGENRFHFAKLV